MEELKKNKKQLIAFILSGLTVLLSTIYLVDVGPKSWMLIYTLLIICSSGLLAFYYYKGEKASIDLAIYALAAIEVGSLIRITQLSFAYNIESTVKYVLLFGATYMLISSEFKKKENRNTLVSIMYIAVAAYSIYSFFDLSNNFIKGYSWRCWLISDATLSISLMLASFKLYQNQTINASIEKYLAKLPKEIITIGIIAIVAAIILFIKSGDNSSSYIPSYGTDGTSGSSSGSSGNVYDNISSDEKEEKEPEKVEKTNVSLNTPTNVKGKYSSKEYEASITITNIYTQDKVEPPAPQQYYYTYYPEQDNKTYLVVKMDVKNLSSETLNTDHIFRNFLGDHCDSKVTYNNKYEYTINTIVGLDKNSDGKYDLDKYYYIDPLATGTLYLLTDISKDLINEKASINLCFGDTNLIVQ